MSQQPSTSQSDSEAVLNFGWPGPLPHFQAPIYLNSPPVDSQGRRCCQIFLGPNLPPPQYSSLKNFLEGFDIERYSGLAVTIYSGSLSSGQEEEVLRLIKRRVAPGHQVELRSVEQAGHEKVIKRIVHEDNPRVPRTSTDPPPGVPRIRKSSSFSIRVDFLNGLPEVNVQRLDTLDNLELIHLLAPHGSFLKAGGIDACRNTLVMWKSFPSLRKCILPLDLFDYLARIFEALQSNAALEEIELEVPVNNEVLLFLHPQGRSYELVMTSLSPPLAQLRGLQAVTIPISFVSSGFLLHIATLPNLVTLTAVQVGTVNPLSRFVKALREAPIHKKGTGCFENLMFLDLGPGDRSHLPPANQLELEGLINAPENSVHRHIIRTIFWNTFFYGDWLGVIDMCLARDVDNQRTSC